jgi:protoporphyrinogen oxidase
MKIVILGAGITGLAAAVELAGYGHEITILEKNHRVGGLATTLHWKNHVFDYGAFVCYPQLKELLPEPVLKAIDWCDIYHPSARLYYEDSFVDWPITPSHLFHRLGFTESIVALKDWLKAQFMFLNSKNIKNAQEFLIKKIGKRLIRYSGVEQEIFKLTGKSSRELSPWFVSDHLLRFSQVSPLNYLFSRFRRPQSRIVPAYPAYPLGGIARISIELENFLSACGVSIKKKVNINRIYSSEKRINKVLFTQNSNYFELNPDFVISTIPLTQVPGLLDNKEILASLTDQLQFRHLLLLFLVVQNPLLSHKQLTYAFDESISFKRLVEFKNYDSRGIPSDQTGIALEICYSHLEEIRNKTELYRHIVNSLEQMGVLKLRDIVTHCFRISPNAYPVETLGYEKAREAILGAITFDNMISCGRQGIFRYCQMPFGYKMGQAAADHIKRGIFNKKCHLELCHEFAYGRTISGD